MSRPSGTYCFRERDVFLKGTRQHNTWKFYGEQTRDKILAYAVELTGTQGGTIRGNLYELDYQQHFRHVVEASQPVSVNRLFYEHGTRDISDGRYFDGSPDRVLGNFLRYEAQPHDPAVLQEALRQEQHSRGRAVPDDFKAHVTALHDSRIETEARRIVDKLKDLSAPNSPNKTHFMVEISPHFDALASTKDNDRLFAMLPYKSLCFTGMKDRHGLYAVIGKDENRDKEVRRPALPSAGSYPKPNRPKPRKRPRPEPRKTNWRYDNGTVYRGRRKPDLYVSQDRPAQDDGQHPGRPAGHGRGHGGAGPPDRR